MSIHSEIRRLRLRKGWSTEQLAVEVSLRESGKRPLSRQAVQQWETEGGTAPSRKRLQVVAEVLETTAEALLRGDPSLPPAQSLRPVPTADVLDLLEVLLARIPPERRAAVAEGLAGWVHEPQAQHRKAGLLAMIEF